MFIGMASLVFCILVVMWIVLVRMYNEDSSENKDWESIIKSAVATTIVLVVSLMLFGLFIGG